VGSRWYQNGQHFLQDEQLWKGESGHLTIPKVSLPAMNVAAVVQAIKLLPFPISDAAIQTGLAEARLAGRYQELHWQGKQVILDVAHNPHAAANLCRSLALEKGSIHGVFAMLSDKDYDAVIKTMSEQLEHWFLAPSAGPRGLDLPELTSSLQQSEVAEDHYHACGTIVEALEQALDHAQPTDKIVVFGSFQTVGEVLAYFEQQQQG
jgi:dihydrofolate synthase/folylpolyglutamate synthase